MRQILSLYSFPPEGAWERDKPIIPPRNNAGYWEDRHPHNATVSVLKSGNVEDWKREEGNHQRFLSETGMSVSYRVG